MPAHGVARPARMLVALAVAGAVSLAAVAAGGAAAGAQSAEGEPTAQVAGAVRIAGTDRIDTAVQASATFWERSDDAVIASAWAFPDALAATALAAARDAPLLLTGAASLPSAVADELIRLGSSRITVVGGSAAVGEAVVDELRGLPASPTVERIGGRTRYETAAAIAQRVGASGPVVIVSGAAFADALAAGSLASHAPILLTAPDALPSAAADALAALAPSQALIVGGTAAVSAAVEAEVGEHVPDVQRLAGATRYITAVAAAGHRLALDPPVQAAVVATGERFPDGLAAGALAARLEAVVLLSPHRRVTDEVDALLRERAGQLSGAVLVGGTAALGNHVEAEVSAALEGEPRPGFEGSAGALPADVQEEMTGVSWRPGCPVELSDLAFIELVHWDLDGQVRDGRLVVAGGVADEVLGLFERLFEAEFLIERVELVDVYGADDDRSMAANNTHGFNCRYIAGTQTWSEHAFGAAIDLNPVQNPYVQAGSVSPPAGAAYLDRADVRPGMIVRPGPVVEAFADIGWGWGGDWISAKDYQHFSQSGR